jgi:hypothetical protein
VGEWQEVEEEEQVQAVARGVALAWVQVPGIASSRTAVRQQQQLQLVFDDFLIAAQLAWSRNPQEGLCAA